MFFKNLLFSCWTCLSGHRANTCQHGNRPLYALKNKGRPRPSSQTRSKDTPDIPSLNSPEFGAFHARVLSDPLLHKEYFHQEDPAKSPRKRAAPYVKRATSKTKTEPLGGMDVFRPLSTAEFLMWKELCFGGTYYSSAPTEVQSVEFTPVVVDTVYSPGTTVPSPPEVNAMVDDIASSSLPSAPDVMTDDIVPCLLPTPLSLPGPLELPTAALDLFGNPITELGTPFSFDFMEANLFGPKNTESFSSFFIPENETQCLSADVSLPGSWETEGYDALTRASYFSDLLESPLFKEFGMMDDGFSSDTF